MWVRKTPEVLLRGFFIAHSSNSCNFNVAKKHEMRKNYIKQVEFH